MPEETPPAADVAEPVAPPAVVEVVAPAAAAEEPKVLTPEEQKAADLAELESLTAEYEVLKVEVSEAAKVGKPDGVKQARKGDVVRSIDVLKRKYDLP